MMFSLARRFHVNSATNHNEIAHSYNIYLVFLGSFRHSTGSILIEAKVFCPAEEIIY